MTAVLLALTSAALFGGMTVALRLALRGLDDASGAALATVIPALGVSLIAAAFHPNLHGAWPFLLAGLLAPGAAQVLFVLAVREAGPARASVIAGGAPLVAVTIAVIALHEPLKAPLAIGAVLIVAGGLALIAERVRPDSFRPIGLAFSFGCTVLFATRDNIVRWLASDTTVSPQLAAAATILAGATLMFLYLVATRRTRLPADLRREGPPFVLPGFLWGASYASLFEAFYRARVTVVSPLVATESLFSVLLAVLLLRRTELVGRHLVLGAVLIVAGGALIGAFR